MTFSFKYKPVKLNSGALLHRPMIPLTIEGKEKLDTFAILDSGSDLTIIPKEIAEVIDIDYSGENEVSGIGGEKIKAKQGKIRITFGKNRESYPFNLPVLVPDRENLSVIIGRLGFFTQFKITFDELQRRIEFKKNSQQDQFKVNFQ